jgi:predicted CoA-binding protein
MRPSSPAPGNPEPLIHEILRSSHTLAVVGFSSRITRAGYYVPAYMQRAGYRILPVNPALTQALGGAAYPDLRAVPVPIDCVIIFRRSEFVPPIVDQAIEVGARFVWMQLGIRNEAAAARAREAGLGVVVDACIMVEHRRFAGRSQTDQRGSG